MAFIFYIIPHSAEPAKPAVVVPPTIKSTKEFECLKDESELWAQRVEINRQFQLTYCDGKPLDDRFVDNKQRGIVPVVFVYSVPKAAGVSNSTKHMITLALNTAAKFNNQVFLLLFGNSPFELVVASNNVEIVRVLHADDPIKQAFDSFGPPLYKHHSKNPFDYELFCFQRWFAISAFLQERKFQHAFVADNDVLLLTNVTREAERCYVGCKTFGKFVYSTYMRTETVQEFCQYITSTYSEGSALRQIRNQYPVVSDMNVHQHFLRHKIINEEYANPKCVFEPSALKQQALVWRYPFDGGFYANPHKQDETTQMMLQTSGDGSKLPHLYQNLHFQGAKRKHILEECK